MDKVLPFIFSFLLMALFLGLNSTATAQNWDFRDFDQTLSLTRGKISPKNNEGYYVEKDEACRIAKSVWGWTDDNCRGIDALVALTGPNIDTLVVETPNSGGYVIYDDWDSSDKEKNIDKIWQGLKNNYLEQAKRTGDKLDMIKWLVYPTLIKEKNYLYYAYLLEINGEEQPQLIASLFDRKGYVRFVIVTSGLTGSSSNLEFEATIESALDLYTPNRTEAYADYTSGDKISEYGVLGVLATLAGVKWGKVAAAGIIGTLLIAAKKLWWIILLPFYFLIKKVFSRKNQ